MTRSAMTTNDPTIMRKSKKAKIHAIDALLGEVHGELYGYSLCGIYCRSIVEAQFVTCKNCLKMLANEAARRSMSERNNRKELSK